MIISYDLPLTEEFITNPSQIKGSLNLTLRDLDLIVRSLFCFQLYQKDQERVAYGIIDESENINAVLDKILGKPELTQKAENFLNPPEMLEMLIKDLEIHQK